MRYFHVDRTNTLRENMTVAPQITRDKFSNKFTKQVSENFEYRLGLHGATTLRALEQISSNGSGPNISNLLIERDFESVRLSSYPSRISRFQCAFACQSLDDIFMHWRALLTKGATVFEIETKDEGFIADASLLRQYSLATGNKLSKRTPGYDKICKYWEGGFSNSPRPEVLVPLPFFVVRSYML